MKRAIFILLASFVTIGVSGSCYDCCIYSTCPSGWTCCGCDNECYCCDNYEFCQGSIPNIKCSPIRSGSVVPSWITNLVASDSLKSNSKNIVLENNSTLRGSKSVSGSGSGSSSSSSNSNSSDSSSSGSLNRESNGDSVDIIEV